VGRYVYSICGGNIRLKYAFARQCSNFGPIVEPFDWADVFRNSYAEVVIIEDVEVSKVKEDIMKRLEEVDWCPLCSRMDCANATKGFIEEFFRQLEEEYGEKIDRLVLYSEHW